MASKTSEEKTKGLVADKLKTLDGYPSRQDVTLNGITWFKEDSYKGSSSFGWLSDVFKKASKKQTMRSRGTPDFIVIKDSCETIVLVECKGSVDDHSSHQDVKEYKVAGYGGASETTKYAIDGALWYASFLSNNFDVIVVSISGDEVNSRVTSFVWPKNEDISSIELIEDGTLSDSLVTLDEYVKSADVALKRNIETEEQVMKELRRYTLSCANFLRSNGIEDNSKAGFVSAIILGLTNEDSTLYKNTKSAIESKRKTKAKKMISDPIGRSAVNQLKSSLYGEGKPYDPSYIDGIWDIDKIPQGKRYSLKKFYDGLLSKSELAQAPKGRDNYFPDGDTVLSCCIYSLYENVIEVLKAYTGIDIMGEFYTTFLRFTKGNAKEKGIVLTPKHITELFCDLAEYFGDKPFDENTKVIDICCGTGAFLISSLNRIKDNIYSEHISETEKADRYKEAQKRSLIGVERDASMFALAYANMRFHGDGKSNLFNCSSLLIDSFAPVDESGMTFFDENKVPLHKALAEYKSIDVGMINPPYSLDKKDPSSTQEYPEIKELNEKKEKKKQLEKKLAELKRKSGKEKETTKISSEIKVLNADIDAINLTISHLNLGEIVLQKGQDELDFIASMLHYLKDGGIGVAIVPMSCAGSSGSKLRSKLLEYHTLLACMTMPPQLFFDSHVGTATCIMVFKAHVPHDKNKATFFGRWIDDGFKVIPHNGRKDLGRWESVRRSWLDQLDGVAPTDDTVWVKQRINAHGEALPEAYVKTDFTNITEEIFRNTTKKRALYRYMDFMAALEVKDSERVSCLLDNYAGFESGYAAPKQKTCKTKKEWKTFKFGETVDDIHNGKSYNAGDLVVSNTDDYVAYVTRTDNNNGISLYAQTLEYDGLEEAGALTIGDTTATTFYQDHCFITGPHIVVVRASWLNVYTAMFIIALLDMEKYRYPVFGRAFTKDLIAETEIPLPVNDNGDPDFEYMEEYIRGCAFSCNIE